MKDFSSGRKRIGFTTPRGAKGPVRALKINFSGGNSLPLYLPGREGTQGSFERRRKETSFVTASLYH